MQPPEGLVEKVRGLQKLKSIADSRPQHRAQRPRAGDRARGRRRRPRPAAGAAAAGPATAAPFITLPAVITHDPRDGRPQRRHVPDADARPAPTACTGRSTRTGAWTTSRPTAGSRSRSRSGSTRSRRTRRRAPLPKHVDEFMLAGFLRGEPVELVKGRPSTSRCPRTRRSCSRATSSAATSPTRARSATTPATTRRAEPFPVFHRHGDDDAARRDLPVDRRRQAARRGRLARQGDRAHLPARGADDRARDRRLRPPGRRRVPQLLHRLDPQGLPRPRAEGDARDLGPRDAQPDEVGRRRRRARRRARLRARSSSTSAPTSTRSATSSSPRARSTISTTRRPSSSSAARSGSTRPRRARRRARGPGRRRSR